VCVCVRACVRVHTLYTPLVPLRTRWGHRIRHRKADSPHRPGLSHRSSAPSPGSCRCDEIELPLAARQKIEAPRAFLMLIRLIASLDLDLNKVRGAARLNEKLTSACTTAMQVNCGKVQSRYIINFEKANVCNCHRWSHTRSKQKESMKQGGSIQVQKKSTLVNWEPHMLSLPSYSNNFLNFLSSSVTYVMSSIT
jgi:hypothetical protein